MEVLYVCCWRRIAANGGGSSSATSCNHILHDNETRLRTGLLDHDGYGWNIETRTDLNVVLVTKDETLRDHLTYIYRESDPGIKTSDVNTFPDAIIHFFPVPVPV